jgi:hypothetical protein
MVIITTSSVNAMLIKIYHKFSLLLTIKLMRVCIVILRGRIFSSLNYSLHDSVFCLPIIILIALLYFEDL